MNLAPLAFVVALAVPLGAQRIAPSHSPSQVPDSLSEALRADFDGDGQLDLLTLQGSESTTDPTVPWLLSRGDGSGLFGPPRAVTSPLGYRWTGAGPIHVTGDFDGDGDADVAWLENAGAPSIAVFPRLAFNDGNGNFTAGGSVPPGEWRRLKAGDLDLDGDDDLIVHRFGPDDVESWLNDGNGNFSVAQSFTTTPSWFGFRASLVDVDGDGDLDFLSGEVWVNEGNGTFVDRTASRAPSGLPSGPYVPVDLNGDTHLDLLTPSAVLLDDGFGALAVSAVLPGLGSVAAVDLELDGDLDAVFTTPNGRIYGAEIGAQVNDGAGNFAAVAPGAVPALPGAQWVEADDVDGDGDLDVWVASNRGVRLLVHDGQSRLLDATPLLIPAIDLALTQRGFAIGDVDGDGRPDVVADTEAGMRTFFNAGVGEFVPHVEPFTPASTRVFDMPSSLHDLNGDGVLDLLTRAGRLYRGDGHGGFVQLTSAFTFTIGPYAVADFDADGDLDAVWGRGLLQNEGDFAFLSSAAGMNAFGSAVDLDSGDLDADGDIDVYLSQSLNGTDQLWLNDGAAQFSNASAQLPAPASSATSSVLVDFEGDGDLDVVSGGSIGAWVGVWVLLNDGAATFTLGLQHALSDLPGTVRVRDYDLDGDVDVLVLTNQISTPGVFLEQVTGSFVDRSADWLGRHRYGNFTDVVDVDADGDGDVLTWHAGAGLTVLHNRRRQLDAPNFARRGAQIVLDAHVEAQSAETVLAFVSPVRLTATVPTPWGPLAVDPSTGVFLPLANAAAGVPVRWTIGVPALASPIGFELFAQALFAPDLSNFATWRFSNVVRHVLVE